MLKADYPCNLKHLLIHFFTIIFPFMQKLFPQKGLNVILTSVLE